MSMQHNDFDSLGRKVRRAQAALEQVRGVGDVDGVQVIVDANNRLVRASIPGEQALLAAYHAALQDLQSQLDEAMREVHADSRFDAISTFVQANAARLEEERARSFDGHDPGRTNPAGVETAW
ncbi:hypothetical protein ACFYO1_01170 [Nocardia sp. NPDC006044]|uniref:hypothetical protein n=1 Tax=Nocardia sp. NPDC006044 TaxID=3364306 RepID=UPI0036B0A403